MGRTLAGGPIELWDPGQDPYYPTGRDKGTGSGRLDWTCRGVETVEVCWTDHVTGVPLPGGEQGSYRPGEESPLPARLVARYRDRGWIIPLETMEAT